MPLDNLDDLEASWQLFLVDKTAGGKWTQFGAWRRDNPGEWAKLLAYREGTGPRPSLASNTGQKMVEEVDAYLEAKGDEPPPPPTGALRWRPPVTSGFADTIRVTGQGPINLQSGKDYRLDIDAAWSSGSGRTSIQINGGRHVVAIGGRVAFNQTNANDDQLALHITGGDPGGIVHLEGIHVASSVNGITLSTGRTVQIQNCHVKVDSQGFPGPHSDMVQVWRSSVAPTIRMHRFTGYTDYTSLVCLEPLDPVTWELYDVDIHGWTLPTGLRTGCASYHNSGGTPFAGPYATWIGSNLWMQAGHVTASRLHKLDDQVVLRYLPGQQGNPGLVAWPYELHPGPGQSGSKYTSPDPATGGNAPYPLGARQGDYLTFERVPQFAGHRWTYGVAPVSAGALNAQGEFVPAAMVGPGYVPVGYA